MIANAHGRNIPLNTPIDQHNNIYDTRAGGTRAKIPPEYEQFLFWLGFPTNSTHIPPNELRGILTLIDALETLKSIDSNAYDNMLGYIMNQSYEYYQSKHNYNPDSHPGQSQSYTSPYGDPDHVPGLCY